MRLLACLLLATTALFHAGGRAAAPAPDYPPALALRSAISKELAAGKLEHVLHLADRFDTSRERLPDGRWKLAVFYGGLDDWLSDASDNEAEWDRRLKALSALAARHPRSSNAWIMLAELQEQRAWAIRGSGFSDTVRPEASAQFHALLTQARATLEAHKALASDNPHWYALRIAVDGADGVAPQRIDALFAEAMGRSDGYQLAWYNRLHYLAPRWGGSQKQMAAFIASAPNFPAAADGLAMVSEMLAVVWSDGEFGALRRPELDWAVVKKSQDAVLQRYPEAFNVRYFVLESCVRPDKAQTAALLARMKTPPTPADLGSDARMYALCTQWAHGEVPMFIVRDHATGEDLNIE